MTWQIRFLANFVWENNAKAFIISHTSLLPICVGASQIEFEATIEIAFQLFSSFFYCQFLRYASE